MPANFSPGAFKFNFVVLIALSCLSLSAVASKRDKVQGSKIIDVTSLITSTAGSYEEVVVVEKPKRSLLQHGHYTPALNHYGGSASKYQFFGGLNLNHYLSPAPPVHPTIHSGHGHGLSGNSYAPFHVPVPTYVPTPTYNSHSNGHNSHSHGHGDSYGNGNGNGHGNSGGHGHGHVMTSHPHHNPYPSMGHGHGNGHGHSANNNYRSFGSTAHFHHNPSYLEEVYKLAEKAVTASHASQAISTHKHHAHQHSGSGGDGYGTGHGHSHNNNYAGPVPNHNSHHMGAGSGYGHGNRGGHGHGHGRGHSAGGAAHHTPLGHMDSYTVVNGGRGHSHSNSY